MSDESRRPAEPTRRRLLDAARAFGTAGALGIGPVRARGPRRPADRGEGDDASDRAGDPADRPLYDAHAHLVPTETLGREPFGVEDLIAWMDDRGIDRAVVLALDSPESYPVPAPSWWILEQVAAHPDRLLPFCTVDPRTLVYGADAVAALVEGYVERGARGIGELKAGLPVDDDRLATIYELAADHDLPVLLHLDEKAMIDDVGLSGFEDVLASYPDVDFLAHAPGWWAHVSADVTEDDLGGYPDRPVEPGGRVPELLGAYDNCYGDLSAASGWNALVRDERFARTFLERYHDRLAFGTDVLYPGQDVPQFDLFDRFDLDAEARADVRYRTLERILG